MLPIVDSVTLSLTVRASIARGLAVPRAHGLLLLLIVLCGHSAEAQNANSWPQILGPERNGQVSGVAVDASNWQASMPPIWQTEVGSGFAGVAIEDGKVLAFHRKGSEELLTALKISDGSQLWEQAWSASYQARINPDNGPRCVPTISGGKVICYGAAGDIHCAQLADGEKLWSRPLRKEYGAQDGYFGAGSSPLVVDGKVIVCLGGRKGGIVALDLETGVTIWTSTQYDASYAAPIAIDSTGGDRLLVVTRLRTVLISTDDGNVIDEIDFGQRGPTVNAATPIPIARGTFLLTASYGIGSTLLQVAESGLRTVYEGDSVMSSQYNTPVLIGQRIVGIDGREDGAAGLVAFDPITRDVFWTQRGTGTANLLAVGKTVLTLDLEGKLTLLDPSQSTPKVLGSTSLPAGTYRALPALTSDGLVVRNNTSTASSTIALFDLK